MGRRRSHCRSSTPRMSSSLRVDGIRNPSREPHALIVRRGTSDEPAEACICRTIRREGDAAVMPDTPQRVFPRLLEWGCSPVCVNARANINAAPERLLPLRTKHLGNEPVSVRQETGYRTVTFRRFHCIGRKGSRVKISAFQPARSATYGFVATAPVSGREANWIRQTQTPLRRSGY
jgi:hypothetical protein